MSHRLILLLAVLAGLVACYMIAFVGAGKSKHGSAPAQVRSAPSQGEAAVDRERVMVTVELASAAARQPDPEGGEEGAQERAGAGVGMASCPNTATKGLLGLDFSRPEGCVVASTDPGGPAGKAGLLAGDSIIEADGNEVTCPKTLLPYLLRPETPGKVTLTVLRAKGKESGEGGGARPASGAEPEKAGAGRAERPGGK